MTDIGVNRKKMVMVPILMYHSVSTQARPAFRPFVVSPQRFAEQMLYLHNHNYTPITVTKMAEAITDESSVLPTRPIVLTFDDGFADFYSDALPILRSFDFVATLYVTTGYLGQTSQWLAREGEADRPMVTPSQLREIAYAGIECGAHGHTHVPLDMVAPSLAWSEIVQSKAIVEDCIGQGVATFAYPFGYYDKRVQRMIHDAGYRSACAVRYAMSSTTDNPFALARLRVAADDDVGKLTGLLNNPHHACTVLGLRLRSAAWRCIRRSVASHHSRTQNRHDN